MSAYFDRGASAGGHDEGFFNRRDVTGPDGVGSATGGAGGVSNENPSEDLLRQQGVAEKDDIEHDPQNPYIARAVPRQSETELGETSGVTSPARSDEGDLGIIEGSDSERTGTSWGLPAIDEAPTVSTPVGELPEGDAPDKASPNRNTDDPTEPDSLDNLGSWSTIKKTGSAGSPTGNS
jgi:hypothetical protein